MFEDFNIKILFQAGMAYFHWSIKYEIMAKYEISAKKVVERDEKLLNHKK